MNQYCVLENKYMNIYRGAIKFGVTNGRSWSAVENKAFFMITKSTFSTFYPSQNRIGIGITATDPNFHGI